MFETEHAPLLGKDNLDPVLRYVYDTQLTPDEADRLRVLELPDAGEALASLKRFDDFGDNTPHGASMRQGHANGYKDGLEASALQIQTTLADEPDNFKGLLREVHRHATEKYKLASLLVEAHDVAIRDPLTGLYNRRGFQQVYEEALSKNSDQPMSLLVLDIDYFKAVNDRLGHQAGDEVLQKVSALLGRNVRSEDTVARQGGEEFVILLEDCDEENAFLKAEYLRKTIESGTAGDTAEVTVSGGVVQVARAKSLEDNLKSADGLLYRAKDNGRNQIQRAQTESPESEQAVA